MPKDKTKRRKRENAETPRRRTEEAQAVHPRKRNGASPTRLDNEEDRRRIGPIEAARVRPGARKKQRRRDGSAHRRIGAKTNRRDRNLIITARALNIRREAVSKEHGPDRRLGEVRLPFFRLQLPNGMAACYCFHRRNIGELADRPPQTVFTSCNAKYRDTATGAQS